MENAKIVAKVLNLKIQYKVVDGIGALVQSNLKNLKNLMKIKDLILV